MRERLVIALCENSFKRFKYGDAIDKMIAEKEIANTSRIIAENEGHNKDNKYEVEVIPSMVIPDQRKWVYFWEEENDNGTVH